MKKTSIIVIISIIIIVISLAISIYMPNIGKISDETENKSISYYLLKRNEKYGVINREGKIIIEPEYEAIVIPNPHKAVFICQNGEKQKVLNDENQEIYTKYKNIEAIELTNVISESPYEKKILKYEKDGKYGLLGIDGKVVVDAKYEEISSLGYKEGEILVKEKGKYGIIDEKGKTIIKNIFDSIVSDQYYSIEEGFKKSGYIVCNVTNEGYRYGYYDYEGSKVLETEYNQITRIPQVKATNDIYLIAAKNGQFGVFINNNKIINTQYQSISYDSQIEMFTVERTGKYGAINEKGVEILKTEYSEIKINGIYIYTKKDEEQKIYDKAGNEVNISFETIIQPTANSNYYIKNEKDNYTILNSELQEISNEKYKYLEYMYDKYFIATNYDGKSGIIEAEGNIITDFKYDLIQTIENKSAIQTINFDTDKTEIYNNEMKNTIEMNNANIENLNNYIKVYNQDEEYYLDNKGNIIEDENQMEKIKESNAILRIGNFKRVTYEIGQFYYIDAN